VKSAVLGATLLLTAGRAYGQDSFLEESCPGVQTAPSDLTACFAGGAPDPEIRALSRVNCIVAAINKWQMQQMSCLQRRVESIHRLTLYPDSLKRTMGELLKVIHRAQTLKQEVEGLACGWRFSPRSAFLRDLYRHPIRLCKPSFQAAFGDHGAFFDADLHEYLDWTSTVTRNVIQDRTVGTEEQFGSVLAGPEYSWQRIAADTGRDLSTKANRPGTAVRLAAQLSADELRVETNTIGMRTQAMLVEQQARDYSRQKSALRRTFKLYLLANVAGVRFTEQQHFEEFQ
jgi:hypothetical protein